MKYLFILCPPYSGSTLLWKLIGTSENVSFLPNEGQFLPELRAIMRKTPWEPTVLPWDLIKETWHKYWDTEKEYLVEKSPSHLIRVPDIMEHFQPVYFLVMVRNPYAHCEGMMRHHAWDAKTAADFVAMTLKQQTMNAKALKNAFCLTYESLVSQPALTCQNITSFFDGLGPLDYKSKFSIHSIDGTVERSITNLNPKKIIKLSPKDLRVINEVFQNLQEEMSFWQYKFVKPTPFYFVIYWIAKFYNKALRILKSIFIKRRN